mmetsp:Transcript_156/g.300  ORF Transcript_156/g.300 Transcript_156/m.300 type:complete len:348 (+) Transcript_156:338-1381(+)
MLRRRRQRRRHPCTLIRSRGSRSPLRPSGSSTRNSRITTGSRATARNRCSPSRRRALCRRFRPTDRRRTCGRGSFWSPIPLCRTRIFPRRSFASWSTRGLAIPATAMKMELSMIVAMIVAMTMAMIMIPTTMPGGVPGGHRRFAPQPARPTAWWSIASASIPRPDPTGPSRKSFGSTCSPSDWRMPLETRWSGRAVRSTWRCKWSTRCRRIIRNWPRRSAGRSCRPSATATATVTVTRKKPSTETTKTTITAIAERSIRTRRRTFGGTCSRSCRRSRKEKWIVTTFRSLWERPYGLPVSWRLKLRRDTGSRAGDPPIWPSTESASTNSRLCLLLRRHRPLLLRLLPP